VNEQIERCETCPDSNLIHFHSTSDLVCDTCGVIIAKLLGEELTYREEQETSEKIVNYSYKRENHFNEWLFTISSSRNDQYPSRSY